MEERQITTQTVPNTTNQEMYNLTMYDVLFMYHWADVVFGVALAHKIKFAHSHKK